VVRIELRRADFPVSPDRDRLRPRSESTLVVLPR
jgi:hypothetical protein